MVLDNTDNLENQIWYHQSSCAQEQTTTSSLLTDPNCACKGHTRATGRTAKVTAHYMPKYGLEKWKDLSMGKALKDR